MSSLRIFQVLATVAGLAWAMRVAGGRLAPKAAIKPLLFLVSRWPVLVAWGLGSAGMLWLISSEAAANGKDLAGQWPMLIGLCLFCGLGFAALVVGPLWAVSRIAAKVAEIPFSDNEAVLYQTAANHFLDGEARGGKMLVTQQHIAFRPHRFNVQLDTWKMPLQQIKAVDVEGTRFIVLHLAANERREWLVAGQAARVATYLTALLALDDSERASRSEALLQQAGLR